MLASAFVVLFFVNVLICPSVCLPVYFCSMTVSFMNAKRNVNDNSTKTGMLYLVDLAGSEMVKKTHATGQVIS